MTGQKATPQVSFIALSFFCVCVCVCAPCFLYRDVLDRFCYHILCVCVCACVICFSITDPNIAVIVIFCVCVCITQKMYNNNNKLIRSSYIYNKQHKHS